MKKSVILILAIAVVLLICAVAYFMPLSLTNTVSENENIRITFNEYVNTDLNSVEYEDITAEQKSAVLDLLEKYTYRRNFETLFSNGTLTGTGTKTLYIFDNSDTIFVTENGKISINGKIYYMKNAEQLIDQIIEIME